MAFDAEGYRQAAKEAGISDDVIKRTIAEQSAGVKDVATKPTQQDVSVEMFPNLVKQVMEYAPEAIGAYLGYKALTSDTAKSVGKSIKDRMIGAPKEPARIEPTMEGPKEPIFSPPSKVGPITNMPGTPEELQKALGPNWEATLAKSEAARKEKQMLAQERARASMGELPAPTAQPPVAGGQPPAPPASAGVVPPQNRIPGMMAAQEMSNPLGGLASAYTEPLRPPPTVAEMGQQSGGVISEAAKAPAESIPPAEKNKGGRPKGVEAEKWTYKSSSELPQGTVFKEGWGGADNWLNDQVGKERAREIRNTFNQGRGFGSGKEALKAAADAMKEAGQLNFMSQGKPFVLSAENRERFGVPPPEQHGRLSEKYFNPKGVKVAGATGLLLSMAEAANAAQGTKEALKKGDKQMAASEAAELLNLHPVTGLLNQLFGTSPQELETLRKADYARKVGGGRGIAPPSAYTR